MSSRAQARDLAAARAKWYVAFVSCHGECARGSSGAERAKWYASLSLAVIASIREGSSGAERAKWYASLSPRPTRSLAHARDDRCCLRLFRFSLRLWRGRSSTLLRHFRGLAQLLRPLANHFARRLHCFLSEFQPQRQRGG